MITDVLALLRAKEKLVVLAQIAEGRQPDQITVLKSGKARAVFWERLGDHVIEHESLDALVEAYKIDRAAWGIDS